MSDERPFEKEKTQKKNFQRKNFTKGLSSGIYFQGSITHVLYISSLKRKAFNLRQHMHERHFIVCATVDQRPFVFLRWLTKCVKGRSMMVLPQVKGLSSQ